MAVMLAIGTDVDGDASVSVPTQLSGLYQLPAAVKTMTQSEVTEPVTSTSSPGRSRGEGDLADLAPGHQLSHKRPMRIRIRMRSKGPRLGIGGTSARLAQGSRPKVKSGNIPDLKSEKVPIRKRIKVIKVRRNRKPGKVFPPKTIFSHGFSKDRAQNLKVSTNTSSLRETLRKNNANIRTISKSVALSSSAVPSKNRSRGKITYASSKVPVSFLDPLMDAPDMGHFHANPDSDLTNLGLLGLFQSHTRQEPGIAANLRAIQTIINASGSPVLRARKEHITSSLSPARLVSSVSPRTSEESTTEPQQSLQFTIEPPPLASGSKSSPLDRTTVTSINDILQTTEDRVRVTEKTPSRGITRGSSRGSSTGPTTGEPSLGSSRGITRGPSTGSTTSRKSSSQVRSGGSSRSSSPSSTPGDRSRPLSIFFEDMHYSNKAAEPGFCMAYCGSEASSETRIIGRLSAGQAASILISGHVRPLSNVQ